MDLCDPILLWFDKRKCLKNQKKYFQMKLYFHNRFLWFWGGSFWPNFQLWPKFLKFWDPKIGAAAKKRGATGPFLKIRRRRPRYRFEWTSHANISSPARLVFGWRPRKRHRHFGVRNGILKKYALAPSALAFTMWSSHVNIGSAPRLLSVAQAQPSVYFLVIGVEYINYLRFAPGACVIELHITQVL